MDAEVRPLLSGIQGFLDETGAESFARLVESLGSLPTTGTSSRVVTWPNVTLVLLADPARFNVLKPEASQKMAGRMGRDFLYSTAPSWPVYEEYQPSPRTCCSCCGLLGEGLHRRPRVHDGHARAGLNRRRPSQRSGSTAAAREIRRLPSPPSPVSPACWSSRQGSGRSRWSPGRAGRR
ncbi:MAG: hypothetical protein R2752_19140 [Vicinamibacterales bacterium]